MKGSKGGKRPQTTELLRRLVVALLCLNIVFGAISNSLINTLQAKEPTAQQAETKDEIKARLLRQAREGVWDPYSSDMSIDEFYAMMELFDEGSLPISQSGESGPLPIGTPGAQGEPGINIPGIDEPAGIDEPGTDEPEETQPESEPQQPEKEPIYIPRTMFMMGGLKGATLTGPDASPLPYPIPEEEDAGESEKESYPGDLDPYNFGYLRPPMGWSGVPVNEESKAVVIVPNINSNNPAYAGDVDQRLFLKYDGYYVRRVTAQNTEATILGAIKLQGAKEYVYYYLTDEKQSSEVSTTMLPAGQKFIVEYVSVEHVIEYEVRLNSTSGTVITDKTPEDTFGETVNVLGENKPDTAWENVIFGENHPNKTDGNAYSFTGYAPYGYRVEFYLLEAGQSVPERQLGDDVRGDYTSVNDGWALGKQPVYKSGNQSQSSILPDASQGPSSVMVSNTFYNNNVSCDRKVIAVVHKNPDPTFFVAPVYKNIANVSGRGASSRFTILAKMKGTEDQVSIPYDFEDLYLWSKGAASKYDYYSDAKSTGGASLDNIRDGNIAVYDNSWSWSYATNEMEMTQAADGTWSFQWTWQGNGGSGGNTLDALAVNGVSITIPFYSKYVAGSTTPAQHNRWRTETTLPDGAKLLVEHLMSFNSDRQHVYRFTVTGARTDVVVNAMNLMQGTGAPEFVVYELDGVTGATMKGNSNHVAGVQYFDGTKWESDGDPELGNLYEGDMFVNNAKYYFDTKNHGASFRFRLADGYDSPVFLWESTREGVIPGEGGLGQASIERNADGTLNYNTKKDVLSFDDLAGGATMDSQHIYKGADGWYYIRITTQGSHRIALLTIIAREVRYVVRYVPSYSSVMNDIDDLGGGARPGSNVGIVNNPAGMPEFTHDGEDESFLWETDNGINSKEYDTDGGAYYDAAVDDVIRLPNNVPRDPNNAYRFVDWVLVDDEFNPIWTWTNGRGDSVQVTTDAYGNRILVNPNGDNQNIHHPALLENGRLVVGEDYVVTWNPTKRIYELVKTGETTGTVPSSWITLTRDGRLAYAKDGSLVDMETDMPGVTDLTGILSQWNVRDADGDAAPVNATSEFRYRVNHINLLDVNQYAIANERLGGSQTDIYVLRLMPTWEPVENPFHYTVALNWVDAQGKLYTEFFDDYWKEVLTDWSLSTSGYLTVQVIKGADPFMDWVAMHPTYTFWDAVNNNSALYDHREDEDGGQEAMRKQMAQAIADDIPALLDPALADEYEEALAALCNRDISGVDPETGEKVTDNEGNGAADFWRLGNYAYQVHEDEATIVVWMYEDKGGLVFRKEVDEEPFLINDQFYFTANQVMVGATGETPLEGIYRAYPEHTGVFKTVTDKDGNEVEQEIFENKDAWLVEFEGGKIVNIVKNDGSPWPSPAVTYFTLEDGEGIKLYVPAGTYTISELGSLSGGTYKARVTYDGSKTPSEQDGWELPGGDRLWLKGTERKFIPERIDNPDFDPNKPVDPTVPETIPNPEYQEKVLKKKTVSQLSARVNFEVGEKDVVHTLIFHNITSVVSIEKELDTNENEWQHLHAYDKHYFTFEVMLVFPAGSTPLVKTNEEGKFQYYYCLAHIYNQPISPDGEETYYKTEEVRLVQNRYSSLDPNQWTGRVSIMAGQRAAMVTSVPDVDQPGITYAFRELIGETSVSYNELQSSLMIHKLDGSGGNGGAIHSNWTQDFLKGEFKFQVTVELLWGVSPEMDDDGYYLPVKGLPGTDKLRVIQAGQQWIGTLTLKPGQYGVIEGVSRYRVEELTSLGDVVSVFTEMWSRQTGYIQPGVTPKAYVVNWYGTPPGNGYLVITETGGDPSETFLYKVTNVSTGESIIVSVKGGDKTFVYAPCGKYMIEEISGWSWRYEEGVCQQSTEAPHSEATVTVTLQNDEPTLEKAVHADYTNERNTQKWLGGDNRRNNCFAAQNSQNGGETSVSSAAKEAMLPADDGKKLLYGIAEGIVKSKQS